MTKIRPVNLIAMVLGLLTAAYSIFGYYHGKPFNDCLPGFGIGIVLFGVAYLNSRKSK